MNRVKNLNSQSIYQMIFILFFQDELFDQLVIPYFSSIEHDSDIEIRVDVIQILLESIQYTNNLRSLDLVYIIEKVS